MGQNRNRFFKEIVSPVQNGPKVVPLESLLWLRQQALVVVKN
jgi:hypothetical protein